MTSCAEFDLTTVQYAALTAIHQYPGVDATRLSGLIAFDRSTLGGVIDRLEAKGLVARAPDKSDRRAKLLYLTPVGKEMLARADDRAIEVSEKILAPLKAGERREFVRMLTVLVEANNEHDPGSIRTSDPSALAARRVASKPDLVR